MCGIIGCLDESLGVSYVLDGLEKLEYRGYDSCGVCISKNNDFSIYKSINRIKNLRLLVNDNGTNIIGHTRWATHGKVSIINAHPISSYDDNFIIVHNGIIENYQSLKDEYLSDYSFKSETDTEVIINLIAKFSSSFSNLIDTINYVKSLLVGSFACLIVCKFDQNKIFFMKRNSPLLIGKTKNGFCFVSDMIAFNDFVKNYYRLNDDDIGYVTFDNVFLFNNKLVINPLFNDFINFNETYLPNTFSHYMEKEIYEEPTIISSYLDYYFKNNYLYFNNKVNELLKGKINNIYLIGSGTSYHAGLMGSYFLKTISFIKSYACVSSEFYPDEEKFNDDDLFIVISQSGETADLISIMKKINLKRTIAICNVSTSSISSLAYAFIEMHAGVEVAVASTKAYLSSVTILYFIASYLVNANPYSKIKNEIINMENCFNFLPIIKSISKDIANYSDLFFLGKSSDYFLSLEASLKLKEISYIHSEAFQSGELKHGTIALITRNTPVIAIISNKKYNSLIRSAIHEVKSRNAKVYVISIKDSSLETDDIILNCETEELSYLTISIIFQLIAYYTALEKNNDIDKPRNLAKSVTVL